MSTKSLEILRNASVAILAVALATVVRLALGPVLGEHVPFVTYFVAVVFAAWYGGLGASIWATVLSSFFAALLFIPPQGIRIQGVVGWTSLAAFIFVGLACAYLSNLMRMAQKRSEAEADSATRQHEELQTTLASIGDGVITTDAQGNVEFLNGVAEQLTGWTSPDAAGRPVQEIFRIINEETRQPTENPVEVVLRDGRTVGLANHTLLIAKDGAERPIDDSAAPIRDKKIGIRGVVLVFRDVTERRRAEQELRESESRKSAVLSTALDAIITMDHQGRIVDFNPAAEGVFGYARDDVVGRDMAEVIIPPAYREGHRQGLERYLTTGEGTVLGRRIELTALRSDGSEFPVELAITPIVSNGPPVFTGILRDITARNQQQAALDQRVRAATYGRDVGLALTGGQGLAQMLQPCVDAMITQLDAAFARIWTLNEAGDVLELQASAGIYGHLDGSYSRVPIGHSAIGHIAAERAPRLTSAFPDDPPLYDQDWAREQGIVSFAGYPLLVGDEVVGVMAVFARHALSETTIEAISSSASAIALGIERARTELRLRDQRERLRTTLASIGDAVITTDTDARITNLNAVAETLTGWTKEAAIGQLLETVFRVVNETTRETVESPARRALDEGVIVGLANHTVLIAKDGSECPIDDSAAPIRDKNDEILGCVLVFRDVRDRRLAEQRLRVREERYRALVTATAQMVWTTDPEGRVVEDSPSWREFTGQSLEQWQGTGWLDAIHPEDRDRARQAWFEAVTARTGYQTEYRVRATDGTYRWTAARAVPVFESDGSIREWVGTNTDITDQRRAEEAVRESEEKFRLMADTIPQLAWMARPDGYIFWYNQRWYEYTGTTPAEMEGWGWRTVHDPNVLPSVIEQWQKSIDEGVPLDMVFPLRAADGTFRPFLTRVNPLRDRNGRIVYWFGTNTDISEQKEVQEELRDILARLSEADRRKDTFLATLAHELRNPLAPIRSGLEIMKLAKDSPGTIEEVRETMERQTQQLITLVDDLLDISRITRDKLELRRCRVQLDEIVRSAVEASRQSIDEARHTLTLAIPNQPIELEADPHRLAQVISNLLNNAAKYTPEGGTIHLSAELHRDQVMVSVKDSGIGIPAEMKDRIFEMFTQIDHPLEKGSTGLGIGLTLVKSLVEMHGGRIEVHSDGESRGSDFRVYLPLAPRLAPQITAASDTGANDTPPGKCRVLVVDDNKAAADMLSMVVKMLGNEVRTANDGQQAVEMAADYLPEVILMDIGMPKMNGYEAARLIRQQPWGQGMLLVALTGWGQEEDKRRTKEAGFDRHLTKPAEPADLQQLFASFSRDAK